MNFLISMILFIIRIVLAFLSVTITYLCYKSVAINVRKLNPLVNLYNKLTKKTIPIMYWENSIGRSKNSDIIIKDPTVSRDHAVLYRRDDGWLISDINSKSGTKINKNKIRDTKKVLIDDTIEVGSTKLILKKANTFNKKYNKNSNISNFFLLILVSIFQFLSCISLSYSFEEFNYKPLYIFCILFSISYIFFIINRYILKRKNFEFEILAIFLSSIGIINLSAVNIEQSYIQIISMVIGMIGFIIITRLIKNPEFAMSLRPYVAIASIILIIINLLIGRTRNGAQNWIIINNISIQPSEIIKIAFILVGTSTLKEIKKTKNLSGFIAFSFICILSLCIMGDFGTACIFFFTFIIISFMRSGNLHTIILILAVSVIGVIFIVHFRPYVMNRFLVWGHCWEHVNDLGYQQTRVLSYISSGGIFGLGIGQGCLKYIFAAPNDLVFGMICEEWGYIVGLSVALGLILLSIMTLKVSLRSRSTFFSIGACSAIGMILFQAGLNIFGCTDILPLTGVTLPFVSLGGSSMICSWGLLAFMKSADERTYIINNK